MFGVESWIILHHTVYAQSEMGKRQKDDHFSGLMCVNESLQEGVYLETGHGQD